jgi:hypothetical protein
MRELYNLTDTVTTADPDQILGERTDSLHSPTKLTLEPLDFDNPRCR